MLRPDIIFLHPPTTLDFRERKVLYGPISDVVPSTPIFEMYPLGFAVLSEHLHRRGFTPRIVNLGMKLLSKPEFQTEEFIRNLEAPVFGIGLHWMPHVHGALETAKLVKKYHPQSKVILGGLSATYFHQDLIKYQDIDFVLRGDSTEEPLIMLMDKLIRQRAGAGDDTLGEIPNLVWKNTQGRVQTNPYAYKPDDLNHIEVNYGRLFKSALGYRDWSGYVPYHNWTYYPGLAVLSCRGCAYNCAICGGSAYATRSNCGRSTPIFRSNERMVQDIMKAQGIVKSPIFIFGDVNQMGEEKALEFFWMLKKAGFKNEVMLEFFMPPSRELLKAVIAAAPHTSIEISPETHDEQARNTLGRPYNNTALERSIADAINLGCERVDVFFMTGLSQQTRDSVHQTARYAEYLMENYGHGKRIFPYITPLSPFIDPGSLIHDHPERFGYRLLANKLEDYRRHVQAPSWKYMLNYETHWMNRDEIAESTYESALEFNRLKVRYGLIPRKLAAQVETRINQEREQMGKIDRWCDKNKLHQPLSMTLSENGYGCADLKWDKVVFTKSTCGSEELDRSLWLFRVIPFPKSARRIMLWFWKAILRYYEH